MVNFAISFLLVVENRLQTHTNTHTYTHSLTHTHTLLYAWYIACILPTVWI